jgi:hypothetical protein
VVVAAGDATGFAIEGLLSPVAGLHEYKTPPVPFSWVLVPEQMETSLPALATIG